MIIIPNKVNGVSAGIHRPRNTPAPPPPSPALPAPGVRHAPQLAARSPRAAALLVSDHVAGRVSLLDLPDGTERAEVNHRHLAEHAGFLALPDGLIACVDDRAGELLVLDPYGPGSGRPLVRRRIPVAVPAEHLAAAPDGRRIAVTTGHGRNERRGPDC